VKLFSSSTLLAYLTKGATWEIFLGGWNHISSTDRDN